MPIRRVSGGYRYGQHGKLYKGKGAKEKAIKQAVAIQYSEKAAGKKPEGI